MKIMLGTVAALALATGATAATNHHRATHARADNGSQAVRELNERSLQQASASTPMAPQAGQAGAMSDSGAPAAAGGMTPAAPGDSTPGTAAAGNAPATAPTTPPQQ